MEQGHYDYAWVGYLDAYGFSAELEDGVSDRIRSLFSSLKTALDEARGSVTGTLQFSDSVFVVQRADEEPLATFHNFHTVLQNIQSASLDNGVAMRGSVAFGPVTTGPFGCFGAPIVRAARMEARILPPIVILPEREIRAADHALKQNAGLSDGLGVVLQTEAVPTKQGEVLAYVIAPPAAKYLRTAHRALESSLVKGPDNIVPAWRAAIRLLSKKATVEV